MREEIQSANGAHALAIAPIRAAPAAVAKTNEKQSQKRPQEAMKGETKTGLRPRGNLPTPPAASPAQKTAASNAAAAVAEKTSGAAKQNVRHLRLAGAHLNASSTDSDQADETAQSIPVAESGFQISGLHNLMLPAGDDGSLENVDQVR